MTIWILVYLSRWGFCDEQQWLLARLLFFFESRFTIFAMGKQKVGRTNGYLNVGPTYQLFFFALVAFAC